MAVVTKLEQKIIEYLDLGLNLAEIQRVLGIRCKATLRFRLQQMQKKGLVERIAYGKWVVTKRGYDCQVCPLNEKEIRVLRLLCDQKLNMLQISQKLKINHGTVRDIARRLVRKGVIRRVGHGRYVRIKHWDRNILLDPIPEEEAI